jgi:hypothetical protein
VRRIRRLTVVWLGEDENVGVDAPMRRGQGAHKRAMPRAGIVAIARVAVGELGGEVHAAVADGCK